MLRGVILGIILGFILVFAGVYFYFATGQAPVATNAPQMPFEQKFAHMAQRVYLAKKPHLQPTVSDDEKTYMEGAKIYKDHCAMCHGLPGEPKTAIANGMFPAPPQLFHGTGVTDDEPWETYWKVSDGIRMTGMPAFAEHLGETRMWQVTLLLKNADKISPAVKEELTTNMPEHAHSEGPMTTAPAPAAGAPATTSAPPETHK